MVQKVFKTGNSLAVTISSSFASNVGVRAGDKVNVVEDRQRGRIVYQFSGIQQLPLAEIFLSGKKKKNKK